MTMLSSDQVRQTFLDFFAARGHRVLPSSSLVPAGDPTLLFTNAGMNQFKDVFLGLEKRDYVRAATSQKCVRAGGKHNDLEQVGRTARHHTFFEMLGNFSFGDYFKEQAIPWAWELITEAYKIPKEKLYATVFEGSSEPRIPRDSEAYECWLKVGVPSDRIFELGMKDNFWAMGDTGPCGPCSEIHYDMGPAASELGHADCRFPCDCGRYVELWNLVFMQFNRDEQGTMTPLPRPSIDTGAGLERLCAVLQGKLSNFDTDLFRPLIEEAAGLAKKNYPNDIPEINVSLRIIADHARASTFLISDGVLPSNEGRGYVLRLIMRRALYHGQTVELNEPFLFKISGRVADLMKGAYPELVERMEHVARAIKIEEERYAHTTRVGLEELDNAFVTLRTGTELTFKDWRSRYSSHQGTLDDLVETVTRDLKPIRVVTNPPEEGIAGLLDGDELFKLHDTFGLRPEFVEDIVKNFGIGVDRYEYGHAMTRQRERGRASWKAIDRDFAVDAYQKFLGIRTEFVGYTSTSCTSRVIHVAELEVTAVQEKLREKFPQRPPWWEIVLNRTPFYAESGGQVGDTGWLRWNGQAIARVEDTYRPIPDLVVHKVRWLPGTPIDAKDFFRELARSEIEAQVDAGRRAAIVRNHTGTHLLHAALRKVLGTHVKQAGSLVAPDHLRFDFTHYASVDRQDLTDIEDLVNQHALSNEEIYTEVMGIEQALASGATALFGEKYGDHVRVVSVGDGSFSKELCGGTHVTRTGEIGLLTLTSEGSVAAGTRRVEALTGTGLLENIRRRMTLLREIEARFNAKPDELFATLERLEESEKKARKQLEARGLKEAARQASDLLGSAREVKGIKVVSGRLEVAGGVDARTSLRQAADDLRPRLGSGVIVLGSVTDGKLAVLAAVTKDLTDRLDAGKIVRAAAALVDGSGGGRRDQAEAGGKSPEKLPAMIEAVPGIIEGML
ncbi:MAG TPA: alanine--tRNA ligase [Terriglobia bacterium]|nr:alanine--tRNA ligase [Terriglobia bacterium]